MRAEDDDEAGPTSDDVRRSGPLPKPPELQDLEAVSAALFDMLQRWFQVGDQLTVDISSVDGPRVATELQDPQLVAGFAMRRLQALHLLSKPGIPTATDVIVMHTDALVRALVEAPRRHLAREACGVDWDQAWEILDAGMLLPTACPEAESAEFRRLVGCLVAAREAVIECSGDRIRIFVTPKDGS